MVLRSKVRMMRLVGEHSKRHLHHKFLTCFHDGLHGNATHTKSTKTFYSNLEGLCLMQLTIT